jgi:hypothetical protein
MNPNHDSKGRFSSGAGMPSTFSVSPKKMKKAKLPSEFKKYGTLDKMPASVRKRYQKWIFENWR